MARRFTAGYEFAVYWDEKYMGCKKINVTQHEIGKG
jgi:hypothetical protein